jgi:hypothetical protein
LIAPPIRRNVERPELPGWNLEDVVMRAITIAVIASMFFLLAACATTTGTGSGRSYYFIDRVDNGGDALTAGCHVEYLTSACAGDRLVLGVRGDSCESGNASVNEYTNNQACHLHDNRTSPVDISTLNCDEACGSRGGTCVVVDDACTVGRITVDSARCECD